MKNKKKIYFIIVAVIGILIAINTFFNADSIVQTTIDSYNQLSESANSEVLKQLATRMQDTGKNSLYFTIGLSIVLNITILIVSIRNNLIEKKGLLIGINIFLAIFGANSIQNIISIISLIVLATIKKEKKEKIPISKQIPKLEQIKNGKYELIIGALLCIIYFVQLAIEIDSLIFHVIYYMVTFTLGILFWKNHFKRDFSAFKSNWKIYIKYMIPRLAIMYVIMIISSFISIAITGNITSANEQALENMNSFIIVPLAVIYAPIVEETIFRGIIHKLIKNKVLFVIVSALVFGLLHTIGAEENVLNTIVQSLPYAVIGAYLAIVYDKTENISTNMLGHMTINIIASSISLI